MQNIINGYDLENSFGIIIENVVNQFLKFPERKESNTHDFLDRNGIDIDLTNPRFKARTFTFDCVLNADSIEDLKNKYFSFFALLKPQGEYQFYNDFVNMQIIVYYQNQIPTGKGIFSNHKGGLSTTFQLIFNETDPDGNLPIVYLVDHGNRYLIP